MDFNTGSGGGPGSGGSTGGPGGPPPPRVSGGTAGGDFDYRDLVPSFIRTAREVLFNPVGFFRSIPRQGDFLNPLLFAVICALISAVLSGIIGFLINLVAGNGIGGSLGGLISTIIFIPIGTAIGLFIGAAIYHLLVLLIIRPSHAGYEATFRVVAYASVLQLLSWLAVIPILGILIGIAIAIYNLVLSVLGIREMHSTTTGRAVAVVLIPVIVITILLVLILGAALLAIFAATRQ
ncbi:MAG: YIP1 family protein [Actinomycetota bacterium]|nr:YIP1 family protein [Rubrobacteraceae bacterium]MDQ3184166.1 YIP1 family protein [Actinomycetota bacterium]MDQ3496525.1 YIP1 family protein [Actinomycetota bacterium]